MALFEIFYQRSIYYIHYTTTLKFEQKEARWTPHARTDGHILA